jgi:formylglycine-generating enzyme required for sulfatase activity
VGKYSPAGDGPYGAADMSGNVWEWTSSLDKPYPYRADDGREDQPSSGQRVYRGGSIYGDAKGVRCALRRSGAPVGFNGDQGFRVVVSPI